MPNYSLTFARVCAIVALLLGILALAHVLVPLSPIEAVVTILLALALLLPF
jgi:uncharacterized membrane protein